MTCWEHHIVLVSVNKHAPFLQHLHEAPQSPLYWHSSTLLEEVYQLSNYELHNPLSTFFNILCKSAYKIHLTFIAQHSTRNSKFAESNSHYCTSFPSSRIDLEYLQYLPFSTLDAFMPRNNFCPPKSQSFELLEEVKQIFLSTPMISINV